MPLNKSKLYAALAKGGQTQGVKVPASADNAAVQIVSGHVMGLWSKAAVEASKSSTGRKITSDSMADVAKVVNQIYRDYSGLTRLNETLKKRWEVDDAYHRAHFIADIQRAVGVDISALLSDRGTEAVVKTRLHEAMGYIKTLDSDLVKRLTAEVWAGIQRGDDALSIQKFIIEGAPADYPKWRARLIARDQTGKLFGTLSQERQEDIGIESYFWSTVQDGAVRRSHADREGVEFRWDNPPDDGHPGWPIECRCVARPNLASLKKSLSI